ncbi:Aste57867_5929 [Aphanomyces stellatus]|uniref:Aste57867_5929 protein n=2 Tax=Aphanomyces stellatus TaxID=120398 RepID=A0A485KG21_9STRA|nr:hypothetical protein As57867_005915 [Aphanomyces stellatus]VFT82950.1 Aste57867_5929 [Aphanomyces stellatus]
MLSFSKLPSDHLMPSFALHVVVTTFGAGAAFFHCVHAACLHRIHSTISRLPAAQPRLADASNQHSLALIMATTVVRTIGLALSVPTLLPFFIHLLNPVDDTTIFSDSEQLLVLTFGALFNGAYLWEMLCGPPLSTTTLVHHVITLFMSVVSCHCGLYDDTGFAFAIVVLMSLPTQLAKFLRQANCSWSVPVWHVAIYYYHIVESVSVLVPVYIMMYKNQPLVYVAIKASTVLALAIVKLKIGAMLRKGLAKCTTTKCDVTNAVICDILCMPKILFRV